MDDATGNVLGTLRLVDLDFLFTSADLGEDVALLLFLGSFSGSLGGGRCGCSLGRSFRRSSHRSGGSLWSRSGVLRDFFVSHD